MVKSELDAADWTVFLKLPKTFASKAPPTVNPASRDISILDLSSDFLLMNLREAMSSPPYVMALT